MRPKIGTTSGKLWPLVPPEATTFRKLCRSGVGSAGCTGAGVRRGRCTTRRRPAGHDGLMSDLGALRETMLAQVRARGGATDPLVADALRAVPRHLFVPDVAVEVAYHDDAIVTKRDADGHPVSSSSQPTIMAIM